MTEELLGGGVAAGGGGQHALALVPAAHFFRPCLLAVGDAGSGEEEEE